MLIAMLIIFLLTPFAYAEHLYPEKAYQRFWCERHEGQAEYVLSGGSRVDCLTDKYAVEFDFARKWQEAIGQALYYGKKTKRTPGIVLILESPEDKKYWDRLMYTIKKRGTFIKAWIIRPEEITLLRIPE